MIRQFLVCALLLAIPGFVAAEPQPFSQLDPTQFDPAVDHDIDMFIGNWKNSTPRYSHGSLVERDILTKLDGPDELHPTRKGAVLLYLDHISYATLAPTTTTIPTTLTDTQEIFYILTGTGFLHANGTKYELEYGSSIVAPPGVEFSIENTSTDDMTMYVVAEPLTREAATLDSVRVAYEFDHGQSISVHWCNIDRSILGSNNGMASMGGLTGVKIDPMTMPQPHSHGPGVEEIWIAVKGDITLFMGKELRKLPIGSAYKIPSDLKTAHSNINFTGEQAKLIHMMKNINHEPHPWGHLEASLYDPESDPDYDMFIGHWSQSRAYNTHGCLVEREILRPLVGTDPLHPTRSRAALQYINKLNYATLEPAAYTAMYAPEGEQEIYYVNSGRGELTSGGETYELTPGSGIFVPEGVEYSIANTGTEQLKMYLVAEPVPNGFVPKTKVVVRNEHDYPVSISVHWANIDKRMFSKDDGLATLRGINPVVLEPMTIAQPHSHDPGVEEAWLLLDGDIRLLMGKQLRELTAGSAYKVPADGMTAHSNINITDRPAKLMWMMVTPEN